MSPDARRDFLRHLVPYMVRIRPTRPLRARLLADLIRRTR